MTSSNASAVDLFRPLCNPPIVLFGRTNAIIVFSGIHGASPKSICVAFSSILVIDGFVEL